jgi:hypothetical protein
MPDPDDFDAQLRNLTSGQAEPARFTELSAAERAKRAPSPPPPPSKLNWRKARKARQLRRPLDDQPRKRSSGRSARRTPAWAAAQRKPAPGNRRQRLLMIARTVGVLIAFAALLYGLHLLGFGPQ